MRSATRARLPAAQRRQAIIETALRAFSAGSYRGVTTAEIAAAAGVSEPVLYRHFDSKRDLYLACLDEAWSRVRAVWTRLQDEQPPSEWLGGRSFGELLRAKVLISNFWIQALTEASEDAVIRRHLRRQLREVHDFVAQSIERMQAVGEMHPDRDAAAEAWVFLGVALLGSVSRRLGGLVEDDFPQILAARRQWLLGERS